MKSVLSGTILTLFLSSFCFAQWDWQNPLPQGNTLSNLFVIDSTRAWASGYYGSLIFTSDGSNWNLFEDLGTEDHLGGIFFISDQVGWLVSSSSDQVYKTINGGVSWNLVASLGFNLDQVYFFDELNGITSGDGHIAKTTNGGINWQNVLEVTNLRFGSFSFPNKKNGWVETNSNKIYHTTDSGSTWDIQSTGENDVILTIQFTSDSIGWLAVARTGPPIWGNWILKSSNGGEDWIRLSFDPPGDITSTFFLNDSTGWVNTNIYGKLFKTTDSGVTFNQISSIARFNSMWFDENQEGWGADRLGRILYSQDGGYNWTVQTSGMHHGIKGISFIDNLKGFTAAPSYILQTTNGGISWETDVGDNTYGFNDIVFYDSLDGIAVGLCDEYFSCSGGIIFKTTDGGEYWDNIYSGGYFDVYGFYSYYFMSKDTGYIGGRDYILKTTNGGDSWNEYYLGSFGEINDIFFIDSLVGWAVGYPTIILKTTDGGSSWNTITHETDFRNYRDVRFLNYNDGFISNLGDNLLKSTDGGLTWSETEYPADAIVFADSVNGYLLGNNKIYRTTNSGTSWQFIAEASTNYHLTKLEVMDNRYFWVAGENGIILKYTDSTVTTIQGPSYLIKDYHLYQNYPNPFNPDTKISYSVPRLTWIQIKIYDILGNEIETLANSEKSAGTYELNWKAANLPSGVYFYQMRAVDPSTGSGQVFIQTRKMILLK